MANLTVPSGRTFEVRPLPKHFYLFYGELPTALSEKAVAALKSEDMQSFEKEILETLSPDKILQTLVFLREAVKYICVKPKISLSPQNADEISPFEISEEDFNFLGKWAMQGAGGVEAEGLNTFRAGQEQTSANSTDSTELRKTAE